MKSLELTLAILKPDVVKVPFVLREIQQRILSAGFYVIQSREVNLKEKDAEAFYAEHKGRFFHNRLVTFMKSGPIHTYILAHTDAIQSWRNLMGPTKTFRSQYEAPTSLRGSFGLSDTRNSTHGSDSPTSVAREIQFFFPHFDMNSWYEKDEPLFRKGLCHLNETKFTHEIINSSLSSS